MRLFLSKQDQLVAQFVSLTLVRKVRIPSWAGYRVRIRIRGWPTCRDFTDLPEISQGGTWFPTSDRKLELVSDARIISWTKTGKKTRQATSTCVSMRHMLPNKRSNSFRKTKRSSSKPRISDVNQKQKRNQVLNLLLKYCRAAAGPKERPRQTSSPERSRNSKNGGLPRPALNGPNFCQLQNQTSAVLKGLPSFGKEKGLPSLIVIKKRGVQEFRKVLCIYCLIGVCTLLDNMPNAILTVA